MERFFNRIKHCRRIATRYDKLAANYLEDELHAINSSATGGNGGNGGAGGIANGVGGNGGNAGGRRTAAHRGCAGHGLVRALFR